MRWWELAYDIGDARAEEAGGYLRGVLAAIEAWVSALYFIGVQWAFAWWVLVDCRRHSIPTSIDHGWFIFFAWPVAVPYHLLSGRGSRDDHERAAAQERLKIFKFVKRAM
jgi:hypothetical protein